MIYELTVGAVMVGLLALLAVSALRCEGAERSDPRDAHGPECYDHHGED